LVGLSNRRPFHHGRIFAGQVAGRLERAGVRLAVLVARDQQPLALRRAHRIEFDLLRVRLVRKRYPRELDHGHDEAALLLRQRRHRRPEFFFLAHA
jgi:hypothetical protein